MPFVVVEELPQGRASDGARRIAAELDGVAVGREADCPRAASPSMWAAIRKDRRDEARERFGCLVARGRHPDDALAEAVATIAADEEEAEGDCDWAVVRALARAHPQPSRDPRSHRPFYSVLSLATTVSRLVQAEIGCPGAGAQAREYFLAFGLTDRMADAAAVAFKARHDERRRSLGLPAPSWDAAAVDDGAGEAAAVEAESAAADGWDGEDWSPDWGDGLVLDDLA